MIDQHREDSDDDDDNDVNNEDEVEIEEELEAPQVVDKSGGTRRSRRDVKPPSRLIETCLGSKAYQMSEQVEAELQKAFATETTVEIDAPGASAGPFQPAPSNLRTIMAMQDAKVKAAWLKSYKKES